MHFYVLRCCRFVCLTNCVCTVFIFLVATKAKLNGLLKQEGVSLQQIVEECIAVADRMASSAAATSTTNIPTVNSSATPIASTVREDAVHTGRGGSAAGLVEGREAGGRKGGGLPSGEAEGLKSLLMGSANPSNEVQISVIFNYIYTSKYSGVYT